MKAVDPGLGQEQPDLRPEFCMAGEIRSAM
jgi:hypothetical protein